MTASQRAKQKCATKQNKPATNSEAANCCCMVAPWEVIEEGRGYHLEVTEVGKGKGLNGTEIDVSKKLEYSNKEDKKFELHIVAPPADKDGKVTYKKVTSKHKFLKKECDLKMLVKSGKIEKSIPEGGSFEIDTNGNIKGAMGGNCEQEADKGFLSDYEIILKSIFNPKSISEKINILPAGSNKCNSQPKVDLYVFPFTKYSGTVRIKYSKERKQPVDKRSIRTHNKTTSGWEFSVNLKGQYGTRIFNLSPIEIEKKGITSKEKYDAKEKEKASNLDKKLGRSESHLLGRIEKVMYYFTEADKENKKYFEKLKEKSTEEAQACAKHYPVFSFDPGTTGIMLGVTGYETQEYPINYMVGKKYNVTLKLNFLTDANIKVDILSLLISRAGGKARKLLSSIRLEACKGWHGIKGEIVVEMSLIGGGTMKFDLKQELSKPLKVYGNGSVKLGLIAKVSAKAEADVWFVTVSGEMSGTMASAINQAVPAGYEFTLGYFPNKNDGCWKAGFVGSGLALYYVLKGNIGIKKDDSTDNTNDDGFGYSASGQASDYYTIFPADKPKEMGCIDLSKYLT